MLLGLALREDLLEGERNPARPVSFDNGASSPRAGRRGAYFSMVMSSPETESWRCVVRVPSPMAPECVPLLVGESDATRTGRQKRVGAPAARAYSSFLLVALSNFGAPPFIRCSLSPPTQPTDAGDDELLAVAAPRHRDRH